MKSKSSQLPPSGSASQPQASQSPPGRLSQCDAEHLLRRVQYLESQHAEHAAASIAAAFAAGVAQEQAALEALARKMLPFPMGWILLNWLASRRAKQAERTPTRG